MPRYTAQSMCDQGLIPLDVYDANGMIINRKITAFDTDTGEVESFICDSVTGSVIIDGQAGEALKRTEKYPAPLTWKRIDAESLPRRKTELWDLQGK